MAVGRLKGVLNVEWINGYAISIVIHIINEIKMNQTTAKNLRDLLIKQQLNSKIRFKGEPLKPPVRK